jgi:hypothetical protein
LSRRSRPLVLAAVGFGALGALLVPTGPERLGATPAVAAVGRWPESVPGREPVPRSDSVPSPESVLGFVPGDDGRLADWSQVLAYLRALDAASERLTLAEVGETTQGRPFVIATLTSEENHARLDEIRTRNARIADPRGLSDEEADTLVAENPVIVAMAFSIHSTEVGGTLASLHLLHRLAASDDAETRALLDAVVLLVLPSHNPDGTQLVAEWHARQKGTPFEATSPPVLYHPYAGHDNNRDWYAFTQAETRLTVEHLHRRWHPQILHDVHQMGTRGARLFVPPYADPWEPNVDPALVAAANALGTHVASRLLTGGAQGVVTSRLFDAWAPARAYPHTHGGVRILSETASARLASPVEVKAEELESRAADFDPRAASSVFPRPWPGGTWRLKDVVETQLDVCLAVLADAAAHRRHWLRTSLEVNRRSSARSDPFAFVVARAGADPLALRRLVDILRTAEVELLEATAPFEAGGRSFDEGSLVVPMQQPASGFAKSVLERQRYPDLRDAKGLPRRPYDATAHTLPLLLGLEVHAVAEPLTAPLRPLATNLEWPGRVLGRGARYALGHGTSELVALGRLLAAGASVRWALEGFDEDGRSFPAGTLLVAGSGRKPLEAAAHELGLVARAVRAEPRAVRVRAPRVGLYRPWVPSMDEGWTRFAFEKQLGFGYQELHDREVRGGRLRDRFDAVVLPGEAPRVLREGHAKGTMPEEYTGGLGEAGVAALRDFVAEGGTLVALDSASRFAIDALDLPVKDALSSASPAEFFCPGSILRVSADASHPLAHGLPAEVPIWFESSPAFEPGPGVAPVLRYEEPSPLLSGLLVGGERLLGRAALVELTVGRGRVVLFGLRPQYRAQSLVTYPALLNALYLSTVER